MKLTFKIATATWTFACQAAIDQPPTFRIVTIIVGEHQVDAKKRRVDLTPEQFDSIDVNHLIGEYIESVEMDSNWNMIPYRDL